MCAACVAQGIAYVGGALGTLQFMGAHAKAKRMRRPAAAPTVEPDPVDTESAHSVAQSAVTG